MTFSKRDASPAVVRARIVRVPHAAPEPPAPELARDEGAMRAAAPLVTGGRSAAAVVSAPPREPPLSALPPDPRRNLFRQRALAAYVRGADVATVLRVAGPSSWLLLLALASLILSATAFVTIFRVDVTGKGPGVLRVPGGALELHANAGGLVGRVHVHSGQSVRRGETLLTLDATLLRANLEDAQKRLSFVNRELEKLLRRSQRTTAESTRILLRQKELAEQRLRVQGESNEQLRDQLVPVEQLTERGLVARTTSDDLRERLQSGVRSQLALQADMLNTEARLLGLVLEEDKQRYHWESEREAASAAVEAASIALRDSVVKAPSDGVIEAVVVQQGELLRPGSLLGRILPAGAPTQVVAFIPERDRAFLKPGDTVRLEVTQLPAAEFGRASAHVGRISRDIAVAEEVAEALGPRWELREPHYRVELTLRAEGTKPALRRSLRAGMLVEATFVLRRRLLLALLLDPVKHWME